MSTISVTINGKNHKNEVEDRTLLVHYLREQLNLTGTHIGCDTSQCGACVVLMDGVSIKACTVLAVQTDGSNITTIEGLAKNGQMHPLQEGFWEKHGLQCGYCTPGMIMSAYDLLQQNPNPTDDQVRHGLEGNLCRCTGYHNIVKAVQYAAAQMRDGSAATNGHAQEPTAHTDGSNAGEQFVAEAEDAHGAADPTEIAGAKA